MAGPTFAFEYATAPAAAALLPLVERVAGGARLDGHEIAVAPARRDIGAMFVTRGPSRIAARLAPFERAAFRAALGWVPDASIGGYAMVNGEADAKLLRAVAQAIVDAHGGHAILDRPHPGATLVEAVDLAGTFGAFADDADYVRANRDLLVPSRFYVVDLRRDGVAGWVCK